MHGDNFPIAHMWDEMYKLYARFGLMPPTQLAVARKLKEETNEFILAMKNGTDEEIADEAADCIFVLLGGLYASGLDRHAIIGGMYRVMAKNGAKMPGNHTTENGTIVKARE